MPKVASGEQMRSAGRLLQVLKSFRRDASSRSLSEISRELDLAPSTVRRLLETLEQEGFVKYSPDGSRYTLHHEVVRLASVALAGASFVQAAAPILDRLNQEVGETVQISIRDRDNVVLLDTRHSPHLLKIFHAIGHRYPAYKGSAAGKVMLAWLKREDLLEILPKEDRWEAQTARGIRSRAQLLRALDEVRKRGFGVNDRETEENVWSVAAPVRDRSGRVFAAVNVPCPASRLSDEAKRVIAEKVVDAASTISETLPFVA
ncbi:IclR family transcriptional regulator [Bradyrhizobium ottawaense]|uniref:IclR family transcriptional regulator n=1 Tax=Bradyrhizobium ottawaense TaxID=931866 RepID=UPI0038344CA6